MLAARGLGFRYPGADGETLRGVDLEIHPGRVTALLGRSGGGKSTLLACLAGLLEPTAGSVALDGEGAPRPGDVGLVLQIPEHQIVASTVERELAFGLEARATPRDVMRQRVAATAARLDLASRLSDRPGVLSAGERQRLVCGAVLAAGSRHLLLDEPTSLLDAPGRDALRALVAAEAAAGAGILLVTQFPDEACWADTVAVLEDGELTASGAPRAIVGSGAAPARGWRPRTEAARLAEALQVAGLPIPAGILSVGELADALRPLLEVVESTAAASAAERAAREATDVAAPPLLRLADVHVGDGRPGPRLCGISLSLAAGGCLVVLGPSGSGKTTLLLTAAGVLAPRSGAVELAPDAGRVGLALQCPERQFAAPTSLGELAASAGARAIADGTALAACARLGLGAAHLARSPFRLSAGEQRRLAIASQLARRPRILLLDEPTAGLDRDAARELLTVLGEMRRAGTALLVATQDPGVPDALGSRVLVLREGAAAAEGPVEAALTVGDAGRPPWLSLATALAGDLPALTSCGSERDLLTLIARAAHASHTSGRGGLTVRALFC